MWSAMAGKQKPWLQWHQSECSHWSMPYTFGVRAFLLASWVTSKNAMFAPDVLQWTIHTNLCILSAWCNPPETSVETSIFAHGHARTFLVLGPLLAREAHVFPRGTGSDEDEATQLGAPAGVEVDQPIFTHLECWSAMADKFEPNEQIFFAHQ